MSTLSQAVSASASALAAERTRIEAAVSNLANAESTRGPDGTPYRRRDVVLTPDRTSFQAALGQAGAVGVSVAAVVEDQTPFRRRYEPSHPDADAEGFVRLPNVDPQNEMVDLIGASRAYQANLTAIGVIRDMVAKALELWTLTMTIDGTRGAVTDAASSTVPRVAPAAGESAPGFGQSLMALIEDVETTGGAANTAVTNMLDKTGDVHDAMIALQRAEMTLQLTVQIRNKLVQAYQDIMRMPV